MWMVWDKKYAKSEIQQLRGLAGRLDVIYFNLVDLGSKTCQINDLTIICKAWMVGWML
jgi:hypothetical protein